MNDRVLVICKIPFHVIHDRVFYYVDINTLLYAIDLETAWGFVIHDELIRIPSNHMELYHSKTYVHAIRYHTTRTTKDLADEMQYIDDSSLLFAKGNYDGSDDDYLIEEIIYIDERPILVFRYLNEEDGEKPAPTTNDYRQYILEVNDKPFSCVFFEYGRYFPIDKISCNKKQDTLILYSSELTKFEMNEVKKENNAIHFVQS